MWRQRARIVSISLGPKWASRISHGDCGPIPKERPVKHLEGKDYPDRDDGDGEGDEVERQANGRDLENAAGRRFDLLPPFGCGGPSEAESRQPMQWRYDRAKGALRVPVRPTTWTSAEWELGDRALGQMAGLPRLAAVLSRADPALRPNRRVFPTK